MLVVIIAVIDRLMGSLVLQRDIFIPFIASNAESGCLYRWSFSECVGLEYCLDDRSGTPDVTRLAVGADCYLSLSFSFIFYFIFILFLFSFSLIAFLSSFF